MADLTYTLQELEAILAKATPGPWTRGEEHETKAEFYSPGSKRVLGSTVGIRSVVPHSENAELIVAAVNALPALLDAAEENERMREALETIGDDLVQHSPSENETKHLIGIVRAALATAKIHSLTAARAITQAMYAVEAMPADELLTKAVMLLSDARDKVEEFDKNANCAALAPRGERGEP